MILLLAQENEPNVPYLIDLLDYQQEPWVRLNGEDIPELLQFDISLSGESGYLLDRSPVAKNKNIKLRDIRAVWSRRRGTFQPSNDLSAEHKSFVATECRTVYEGLYSLTPGARWMNNPWREREANNTFFQLMAARDVGLNIPDSIVTQSPDRARSFYFEHSGRVIVKKISKVPLFAMGNIEPVHTSEITEAELDRIEFVKYCPTLFQAKVDRLVELRVTVVEDSLFCAATEPDYNNQFGTDIRKEGLTSISFFPYSLPAEIEVKLRRLMKRLGLSFGAIDLILDESGNYVFLELNPSGQWGWTEGGTGYAIMESIADWLRD